MDQIKIPKHTGPDGQGLPRSVFEKLLELIKNKELSSQDTKQAIELCLSASKEQEWNEIYAPELKKLI